MVSAPSENNLLYQVPGAASPAVCMYICSKCGEILLALPPSVGVRLDRWCDPDDGRSRRLYI